MPEKKGNDRADMWVGAMSNMQPLQGEKRFDIRCNIILKTKCEGENAGEVMLIKRDHIYNIIDYDSGIMVIIKSPHTMLYNDAKRISINTKTGRIDSFEWSEEISQSAANKKVGFPAGSWDLASVELVY